jgi:hypothetical protein
MRIVLPFLAALCLLAVAVPANAQTVIFEPAAAPAVTFDAFGNLVSVNGIPTNASLLPVGFAVPSGHVLVRDRFGRRFAVPAAAAVSVRRPFIELNIGRRAVIAPAFIR